MAIKKFQKMFYYSSEYTKKFIETRIEDLANKTQRSSSFIIENILMDGLLPQNEEAKNIIRHYLYPDDGNGSVQKTLDAIFSNNAAGLNWASKHSNFKPLVEYCIYYSSATATNKGSENLVPYLLSQLKSIVERIENCRDACIEPYDRKMYALQLEMAEILLKNAKEEPKEIVFKNHFQLVYDCWDILNDWSITYRYLGCLARMCGFQENTNARNKLYDIISGLSLEWQKGEKTHGYTILI